MQLEAAATWWAQNRPAAPDAIRTDFQEAIALLQRQPGVGAKSRTTRFTELRRLFLSRVSYHIYYYVRAEKVMVVAFWHASRGSGPNI
jgi:plasmid stabilization system protein ParE